MPHHKNKILEVKVVEKSRVEIDKRTSPEKELAEEILMLFSEYYRKELSNKIKKGIALSKEKKKASK